ncbi:hypothetical protein BBP40_007925 [Aspergillus hancockii]|nr:hypothetical protein BBP40_007925 [Aspergillus hancockii]
MSNAPLPTSIDSPELWNYYANKHDVQALNIYQLERYDSASKIGDPQYLALRALWSIERRTQFNPHEWGIQDVDKARQKLSGIPHWGNFIQKVAEKAPLDRILPISPDLGSFTVVWYNQQQILWIQDTTDHEENVAFSPVTARLRPRFNIADERDVFLRTPSRPRISALTKEFMKTRLEETQEEESQGTPFTSYEPDTPADNLDDDPDYDEQDIYPPVSDEVVVNTYLVNFANTITISIEGVKAHWSAERKGYKVGRKQGGKFIKLYEARTDVHLFLPNDGHSKMIGEVKPVMRGDARRVRMQETAQMAAWIHAERDNVAGKTGSFRRFLLSQNRHEIYLICATYNDDYIDYLTNPQRDSKCQSFLKMNEYGPWNIGNSADVEDIASIILAVTLQFGDEPQLANSVSQ